VVLHLTSYGRGVAIFQVQEYLGLVNKQVRGGGGPGSGRGGGLGRFLAPVSEFEFSLTNALDELQPNSFSVEPGHRPQRATGAALAVAAGLMEGCLPNVGSRIMLFVAGPTTVGPGLIVDTDMGKSIRTHQDLVNDRAPHHKKACKFYTQLSSQMVANSHVLDIFACSLDQVHYSSPSFVSKNTGCSVLSVKLLVEIFWIQICNFRWLLIEYSCFSGLGKDGDVIKYLAIFFLVSASACAQELCRMILASALS
jgi:hypothetical protein